MYTVLGLRQLDQRAALVAHPQGELYRRMSEGLDLIPLAVGGTKRESPQPGCGPKKHHSQP